MRFKQFNLYFLYLHFTAYLAVIFAYFLDLYIANMQNIFFSEEIIFQGDESTLYL